MSAIAADRRQRVPRIGPRQGALQPRPVRDPADRRVVPDRPADGRAGRARSSRISAWRRRRSSGCSSRSSSASAWCRRKSSAAASTACSPSRSTAISSIARQVRRPVADARRQRLDHGGRRSTPCSPTWRGAFPPDVAARRGTRRRSIPRCSRRSALILVELMIVTAIALFFSTFSTPMLSAAFTFGAVRRRPLQHRPAQLRAGRRFAGRGTARPRPVLGAAEPGAVRREGAGRPRPPGAARLSSRSTVAYAAALHRACC